MKQAKREDAMTQKTRPGQQHSDEITVEDGEAEARPDKGKRGAAKAEADGKKPKPRLGRKDYEAELERLHGELVKLQQWVVHKGLKVCVVFEGRDGAGKGGTIKAITERVSPRVFRVVALPAPTEREKSQMYVQRYLPHLPAAGEVVIFDRSWYNRAGVERVMGFCTEAMAKEFLRAVPLVEQAIIDSGVILLKYWLEVSPEEQTRRLESRIDDPRKVWKLSPMDIKSYTRWNDYSKARDDMFSATDTDLSPWNVARSDDKRRARLNIITHLLAHVPYGEVKREKVKLPKRHKLDSHRKSEHPIRYVEERF
ncbi:polyphosphate kinase 2 [Variovorax dokdonensis]|uniref:ADP/GDP-polyphosphate phosphotransferase n=1 Tax=Variovorax dokdonensis TaxID=344883 RepID=A0ABT7NGP5_9BURK|nr:polyphosphate kinase 2 [Variovorax dokdonensis]MDM0047093.1 polyphosphate kinase 2 [Variovorax dokdonensis]